MSNCQQFWVQYDLKNVTVPVFKPGNIFHLGRRWKYSITFSLCFFLSKIANYGVKWKKKIETQIGEQIFTYHVSVYMNLVNAINNKLCKLFPRLSTSTSTYYPLVSKISKINVLHYRRWSVILPNPLYCWSAYFI